MALVYEKPACGGRRGTGAAARLVLEAGPGVGVVPNGTAGQRDQSDVTDNEKCKCHKNPLPSAPAYQKNNDKSNKKMLNK